MPLRIFSYGLRRHVSRLGQCCVRRRPIGTLIAEMLALPIDVLVSQGTPLTRATQSATKTVPIVSVTGNPVGTGLVTSFSHPGGNITGLSLLSGDYSAKWLELLRTEGPAVRPIASL